MKARRIACVLLVMSLACEKHEREHASAASTLTATSAAAATPSAYPDSRITRFTQLVGKTKQEVVEKIGPPTSFEHLTGMFTYRSDTYQALMSFYDPERENSLFGTRTRGGAATLLSLSFRFEWKPAVATVLRSINAPETPVYMRVSKSHLAWKLTNQPQHRHYVVALGGVQRDGYAYEVFVDCSVPPLTGTSAFNYGTNRMEIQTLSPNPSFAWSRCTPISLRMNARENWEGYKLSSYEPRDLNDRLALDGSDYRKGLSACSSYDESCRTRVREAIEAHAERHAPEISALTAITFSDTQVTVSGVSTTTNAVASLLEGMKADPLMGEPTLTTLEMQPGRDGPEYEFQLHVPMSPRGS